MRKPRAYGPPCFMTPDYIQGIEDGRTLERESIIRQLQSIIADNPPSFQGDENNKVRKQVIDMIKTRK